MHCFSHLFDKVLYMFWTSPLFVIGSILTLYTRNRWWRTVDLSKTCRVLYQINLRKCILLAFIIRISLCNTHFISKRPWTVLPENLGILFGWGMEHSWWKIMMQHRLRNFWNYSPGIPANNCRKTLFQFLALITGLQPDSLLPVWSTHVSWHGSFSLTASPWKWKHTVPLNC